jgi:hypothetical protein
LDAANDGKHYWCLTKRIRQPTSRFCEQNAF